MAKVSEAEQTLRRIVKTHARWHRKENSRTIKEAYRVAEAAHAGTKRKSGEDYIHHPLAVTEILAELGASEVTLVAALLHDTVEDTDYTLDQLKEKFGDEAAFIVDGVTKLDAIKFGKDTLAGTVRKVVLAASKDVRVLVVKLADRLHNMRTIEHMPPDSQQVKARQTLELYAPLAGRLGLSAIQGELEDLAFKALEPKMYEEIDRLMKEVATKNKQQAWEQAETIRKNLLNSGVKATVVGRTKRPWSVYRKMLDRNVTFSEVLDLNAVRVITTDSANCYAALGVIHRDFTPVIGAFKDYIAMPKPNGYQSLHTIVRDENGNLLEVQIRTHEMHSQAEYGVASHWRYKAGGRAEDYEWLDQVAQWATMVESDKEFAGELAGDLRKTRITTLTPKGKIVTLPNGSTPIDFAYAIHTQLGHTSVGCRINGELAPLETTLQEGDIVQILTSRNAGPPKEWLDTVASAKARGAIRNWHRRGEQAQEEEKEEMGTEGSGNAVADLLGRAVKIGTKDAKRAGACCLAMPGDLVTVSSGGIVHRATCPNHRPEKPAVLIAGDETPYVSIRLKAIDRPGLLAEAATALSKLGVDITGASVTTEADKRAVNDFTFKIADKTHLDEVIKTLQEIAGVWEVARKDPQA